MDDQALNRRDAIHVPYITVTCPTQLNPGDKCSLRQDDGKITCVKWGGLPEHSSSEYDDNIEPIWHGVADPFSEAPILAGQIFALYLRKECFRELRHDFTIEVHDRGGTSTCHQVCDIF